MPQSKKLVLSSRASSRVPWIGVISASFLLWSILAWCIWQVSIGLF